MMQMLNLCIGAIFILLGVFSLMIGANNEVMVNQFNFIFGVIYLIIGGIGIGIWIGEK